MTAPAYRPTDPILTRLAVLRLLVNAGKKAQVAK